MPEGTRGLGWAPLEERIARRGLPIAVLSLLGNTGGRRELDIIFEGSQCYLPKPTDVISHVARLAKFLLTPNNGHLYFNILLRHYEYLY